MCDVTNLFKAIIKTMKLTEKASINNPSLLKGSKPKSEFALSAREVVSLITKLRDYLYENKKDYMESIGFRRGTKQLKILDAERDKIDLEAERFIKTCHEGIQQLSLLVSSQQALPQTKESKNNILLCLQNYLIEVCKMFSEQKSLRVNKLIERKRISRLEPDAKLLKKFPDLLKFSSEQEHNSDLSFAEPEHVDHDSKEQIEAIEPIKRTLIIDEDQLNSEEQLKLTSEEKIMLQLENERLYNEMSGMVDELKQIESKIVEISKLQEIFTENILQQEKDIYKMADTIVGTTENIKGANEEIREAMKNKAGILVYILFFLIVNTLSLLFLDWYND